LDFGLYPPEINSGRMYAGAGSGPMLAAAAAWDGLAAELHATASSYQSVVSGLAVGPWSGPSSASMAAAGASYAAWLHQTAAQVEETAARAKAAAAAYEAAFTSTVPPPVIAANRSQLMALVATNLLGQNTPAIAATEAQYAEMWAQDAAAMYSYAASSASATTLNPFMPPHRNTNPSGSLGQTAAVGRATAAAGGNTQSTVSTAQQAFAAVPNALQSLATAAPAASADPPSATTALDTVSDLINIFLTAPTQLSLIGVVVPLSILSGPVDLPFSISSYLVSSHTDDIVSGWNGEESWPGTGPAPVKEFPAPLTGPRLAAAPGPAVSAGLGQANTVGTLSVPPTWTTAAPQVRNVAVTLPAAGIDGFAGAPLGPGPQRLLSEMGLAGMTGRGMAGPVGAGGEQSGKVTPGRRVAARSEGAETTGDAEAAIVAGQAGQPTPRTVVTGIAAAIRELARQRDEGRMSDEEFTEQKKRLLGR
jgi:PPE-repeat protein